MQTYEIQVRNRNEQPTAVAEADLDVSEIAAWLERQYGAIAKVLAAQGSVPSGPPFARYHHREAEGRFHVEAGFPVTTVIEPADGVGPSTLPGGPVVETVHTGSYDTIEPAYGALACWVHEHDGELAGAAWEVYLTSPGARPDPGAWRTAIVQPYRIH
ncbi:GyrI-like domain-containing protein [Amycolatopsis sp. FBCC-B4732]|uniref:GyrI-like domain-containing protein n=1 Tax=Amycolatopsis sp. FBCC-B4732 TaxID=3079339 RepID=UPI001FF60D21|nr:GyrI-like domain-containing protein [Amycolatopsis sp. FBCC-B4732]UOX90639.1 GyrI-like domain-containing protein [Amycolatopsis sp. FBCC-B4732]